METERLIIDGITEKDRQDYFENISHDKKVLETFICRYAETPDEVDVARFETMDSIFAIRLKETGKLIGVILYFDEKEDSCEIGYGIGSGFWNRGYTTEAVKRFIDYCFYEKGFRTVYASFFTGNDASRRVMEKSGMRYCRRSEKELEYLGVWRDLDYYEITRPEA
ncbi:MAG: GNAT family N-acetyltransferase [Clostridia bacterium]|nr:GNAT family N-acetyltransferase [Clostridia bacterium]